MKPQLKLARRNTVNIRTDANIRCQVTGYPTPKISWQRLDALMPNNAQYADGKSIMILKKIVADNSGIYKCIAENQAGTVEATTVLLVKGE